MQANSSLPPLDILYVIGALELGGSERHLSWIARALASSGARICVYSIAGDGPLSDELRAAGIDVLVPPIVRGSIGNSIAVRALRLVLAGFHLTIVMIRKPSRIVHFFLPAAYLIGGVAASIARVKTRVMSRRSLNIYQAAILGAQSVEKLLHHGMTAVLGNSKAVVKELRDEGIAENKLGLIYNGIEARQEPAKARTQVLESLGLDDSKLVFVIVANLIPYKGHLDLMAALGIANGRIAVPWHLLIVGRDDGAGASIVSSAKQSGIEQNITLLGPRRDVADLLAASDVGLLCSHQEGFSNAILEGMAASLPMIVTDVGGNAEAVTNGETGYVVPARDPAALADSIVRLAGEPAIRKRFGEAGRKRLESEFSLDACVANYKLLYRTLLQGKCPGDIAELRPFA